MKKYDKYVISINKEVIELFYLDMVLF